MNVIKKMARMLSSVHVISTTYRVCWTSLCVQHALSLTHSSCVRVTCTFCDTLWPEVQSHSDNRQTHVTAPCSAHAPGQTHPTMSYTHLDLNTFHNRVHICTQPTCSVGDVAAALGLSRVPTTWMTMVQLCTIWKYMVALTWVLNS